MSEARLDFAIRRVDEQDLAYVRAIYRRSTGNPGETVTALLSRGAEALVATGAPEEPGYILGWILWEAPNFLHYVYTRELFRGQGIAHMLLAQTPLARESKIWCSHWTKPAGRYAPSAFTPIIPKDTQSWPRTEHSRSTAHP